MISFALRKIHKGGIDMIGSYCVKKMLLYCIDFSRQSSSSLSHSTSFSFKKAPERWGKNSREELMKANFQSPDNDSLTALTDSLLLKEKCRTLAQEMHEQKNVRFRGQIQTRWLTIGRNFHLMRVSQVQRECVVHWHLTLSQGRKQITGDTGQLPARNACNLLKIFILC